jgi:hypothetical protein
LSSYDRFSTQEFDPTRWKGTTSWVQCALFICFAVMKVDGFVTVVSLLSSIGPAESRLGGLELLTCAIPLISLAALLGVLSGTLDVLKRGLRLVSHVTVAMCLL